MKDKGLWNYRYVSSISKFCITLHWSKELNFIRCNHYRYEIFQEEWKLIHTYIDETYTKADVATAKQFYEILINSFRSDKK